MGSESNGNKSGWEFWTGLVEGLSIVGAFGGAFFGDLLDGAKERKVGAGLGLTITLAVLCGLSQIP